MPWKPTKLKFFGIAIRRRTLYTLTLFFAILEVPAVSWAILVQQTNVPQMEKYQYIAGAGLVMVAIFQGWWLIARHNPIIYQHEARVILLGGMVLLVLITWFSGQFATAVIRPGKLAYGAPLALGGAMMVFLVARLILLGRLPKHGDIVRGESGPLRKKRSVKPGDAATLMAAHAAAAAAAAAKGDEADGDEGLDDEAVVEEDSTPTQPGA